MRQEYTGIDELTDLNNEQQFKQSPATHEKPQLANSQDNWNSWWVTFNTVSRCLWWATYDTQSANIHNEYTVYQHYFYASFLPTKELYKGSTSIVGVGWGGGGVEGLR